MTEIKVLIEGYAKEKNGSWIASATAVLIKDSGLNIIVDPGTNKELLLKNLKKEGIQPKDIKIVFLTHYHIDHLLNLRLFPNADVYTSDTIWRNDKEVEFFRTIPKTNIAIIPTPGHSSEHCALLVETTIGKIIIAGDNFWWKDGERQKIDKKSLINHKDPYLSDKKALINSRRRLLKLADWIIPGHGKIFKVPK